MKLTFCWCSDLLICPHLLYRLTNHEFTNTLDTNNLTDSPPAAPSTTPERELLQFLLLSAA